MYSITLQNAGGDNAIESGDRIGRLGFAASSEFDGGASRYIVSYITSQAEGLFGPNNNPAGIVFATSSNDNQPAVERLRMSSEGHFIPLSGSAYDVGSNSLRFRTTYSDLIVASDQVSVNLASPFETLDVNGSIGISHGWKVNRGSASTSGAGYANGFNVPLNNEHGTTLNTDYVYVVRLSVVDITAYGVDESASLGISSVPVSTSTNQAEDPDGDNYLGLSATPPSTFEQEQFGNLGGANIQTGSSYLVWYNTDESAWVARPISEAGDNNAHCLLTTQGANAIAYTPDISSYEIFYVVETYFNDTSSSLPHFMGSDFQWQRIYDNLYYNDGPVGIGTASPSYKLDVAGGGHFDDNISVGLDPLTNNFGLEIYKDRPHIIQRLSNPSGSIIHGNWYGNNEVRFASIVHYGPEYSAGSAFDIGPSGSVFVSYEADIGIGTLSQDSLIFGTYNTERARINPAGWFGVGTDNPSAKLNVENGNVVFNDLGGTYNFRVEGDADENLLLVKGAGGDDKVGVGTSSLNGKFNVYQTTENQSYQYGIYNSANHYTTTGDANYVFGNYTDVRKHVASGVTDAGYVMGADFRAALSDEGSLSGSLGLRTYAGINQQSDNGTLTAAYGIQSRVINNGQGTANINTARGIDVYINGDLDSPGNGGITNAYGVYIQSILNSTNTYGLYQVGSSDKNYFAGDVGIGTDSPDYKLDVNGTFSANSINVNDQFTFPTTDGSDGQSFVTDGAGNVSWGGPFATPEYVASRGENLLTNGTAYLGDNTNFSSFTFDGSEANNSPGSFKFTTSGQTNVFTDEFMPVLVNEKYNFTVDAKSLNGTGRYFMMAVCYDIDENEIAAYHHMYLPNTTTTLAQDLNDGDTTVFLTDASNWENNTIYDFRRAFIFWNYTNSFGYQYPAETYSRNYYRNYWANSGIVGNDITLSNPWANGFIPAGTQVSNGNSGGSFKYNILFNVQLNTSWTTYTGIMQGVDYTGLNDQTKFSPGTAKIKLGWIMNYDSQGVSETAWFTNMSVALDPVSFGTLGGSLGQDLDLNTYDIVGTGNITIDGDVEANQFIGNLRGAIYFTASAGEALTKGDAVYISGTSGNTTVVSKADANDSSKMPAFGIAAETVNNNANVNIITFGSLYNIDTDTPDWDEGDALYVSNTAGTLSKTAPTGESSQIQKIAKVTRRDNSAGSIKVMGAGRSNATPNLDEGRLFVGNSSNQAVADGTIHVDISNSRVGIGQPSPATKLHIAGDKDGAYGHLFIEDTTSMAAGVGGSIVLGGKYTTAGDTARYGIISAIKESATNLDPKSAMVFYTNDAVGTTVEERMRITSDGRVGIGLTPAVNAKLDVNGSIKTLSYIQFATTNGYIDGQTSNTLFYQANVQRFTNLAKTIDYATFNSTGVTFNDGGAARNFTVEGNGEADLLFVDSSSNKVGIGKTPSVKLDVDGQINSINASNNKFVVRTNNIIAKIQPYDPDLATYIGNETNHKLVFRTNNLNRITILNGGDVGVGIDNPSYKLHVNGTAGFASTIDAPNIGAGVDNSVVILDSGGKLRTDEIDGRVWGSSLVDGTGVTSGRLSKWSDSNTLTSSSISDNGTTVSVLSDLVISGDLTVNGTTVYANVDKMQVVDPIIHLGLSSGNVVTNTTYDRGIALELNGSTTAFMGYDVSASEFVLLDDATGSNNDNNYAPATYGDLHVGGIETENSVLIEGGVGRVSSTNHAQFAFVGGGHYSSGPIQGYIKITLPVSWTDTMMSFDLDIYEWGSSPNNGLATKITIGGYNYSATSAWLGTTAHISSDYTTDDYLVQFGHDGTKCSIYLSKNGGSTTWTYPVISINNVKVGHIGGLFDSWDNGWVIGVTPILGTISPNAVHTLNTNKIDGNTIVLSDTDVATGASVIDNVVSISLSDYETAQLAGLDASTLYVVSDAPESIVGSGVSNNLPKIDASNNYQITESVVYDNNGTVQISGSLEVDELIQSSGCPVVISNTGIAAGSDIINNVVSLTNAEYAAQANANNIDEQTLYVITDPNAGIFGSGTQDYVARWTSSDVLATGVIKDDGAKVTFNPGANQYSFPTQDGSFSQILVTDGNGNLTFKHNPAYIMSIIFS